MIKVNSFPGEINTENGYKKIALQNVYFPYKPWPGKVSYLLHDTMKSFLPLYFFFELYKMFYSFYVCVF